MTGTLVIGGGKNPGNDDGRGDVLDPIDDGMVEVVEVVEVGDSIMPALTELKAIGTLLRWL